MATSDADVCNIGLSRIGETQFIGSLDEAKPAAKVAKLLYADARDQLLAAFPWPFATKHLSLALLSGVTRSGWAYVYAAPTDCVAARYVFNGARPGAVASVFRTWCDPCSRPQLPVMPFELELNDAGDGKVVVTDQAAAELIFTARVTAVPVFTPLFLDALAWRMAGEFALALQKKPDVARGLFAQSEATRRQAEAAAFRETGEDEQAESQFITARG